MKVQDFISKLDEAGGLAPMNRFMADITPPQGVTKPTNLNFFCDTAPHAAKTVMTSDLKHYGPVRKMARELTYAEFLLGFIITNAWEARNFFIRWIDSMVDPTTANIKYYDSYKGDIKILSFDQSNEDASINNATCVTHYIDTFPTNVDAVTMDWSNNNTVGKFNVNFVCRKHVNL